MAKVDIVALQGMGNCRKFAGLKLFRSGRPDEATHDDIKTLFFHDIPIIIDFRDKTEILVQETDLLVNSYYKVYQFVKGQFKERDSDVQQGAEGSKKATTSSEKAATGSEKATTGSEKAATGSEKAATGSEKAATSSEKAASSSEKSALSLEKSPKDSKQQTASSKNPPVEAVTNSESTLEKKQENSETPPNNSTNDSTPPDPQNAAATTSESRTSETPVTSGNTAQNHPEHRHYYIPLAHCLSYHMALFKRAPVSVQFRIAYYFLYDKKQGTNRSHGFGAKMLVNPHGLLGLYKDLIQYSGPSIAVALKLLCEPSNAGALICCSLGKDRTGILSALVLHICGRGREEICADYARSKELIEANEKMHARAQQEFKNNHLTDPSFPSADYSTMKDLLEFIDTKYGSIDKYLDSIEFDEACRERLRKNLIEDDAQ